MKELSLEQMMDQNGSGNARCFFFGAAACLASLDPLAGTGFIAFCRACAST